MFSLALCVGVAFLLLAGSALAGTTALAPGQNLNVVALQSGKAAVVYTIPDGVAPRAAAVYSSAYTRTMAVARQVASGDFFLDVTLLNGFTFNAGRLPLAADVTLTTPGGGTIGAITIFNGGAAGNNSVRFRIPVTGSFSTAPVFTVATAGWMVNDVTGFLSGSATATSQIDIKTFDANTGVEIDTGVSTVNFMTAVNALAATIASTTATVDTAATSARKNLVAAGGDTLVQDNGASVTITVGNAVVANNVHNNLGVNYTVAAGDFVNLIVTGNLSGIKYLFYNWTTGTGAAPEVRKTIAPADVTAGFATIAVPGSNALITALSNGSVTVPLTIEADGTTQLTTRTFTVAVEATCALNAPNNRTGANALLAAGTTLSTWSINGTVLMSNWANANAAAWKSRFYIFNETSTPNATVIVRMFQIPISSNATAPTAQIGNTVTLSKALGAVAGMTIRLEDVIAASGATTTDLAGPDGSYNIAVEITIYTQGVGVQVGGVTGYSQTFNVAGTIFTGTSPLSKIQ